MLITFANCVWTQIRPKPGHIAQSVTCLTADTCMTAECRSRGCEFDPGPVRCIDNAIISTAILLPPADSRRVVVSYKRKCMYVHEVLVICLVKLAQQKSVVCRAWYYNKVCVSKNINFKWVWHFTLFTEKTSAYNRPMP